MYFQTCPRLLWVPLEAFQVWHIQFIIGLCESVYKFSNCVMLAYLLLELLVYRL